MVESETELIKKMRVNDKEFASTAEGHVYVDSLIANGEYVEVQYADGAAWEFGPDGYSRKLNNA